MDTGNHTIELIHQDIVKNQLQVTALIQVNIILNTNFFIIISIT